MEAVTRTPEPRGAEGASTRAPATPSPPGLPASLPPVSDRERLYVLERLLRLVDHNPRALLDPTTLLLVRLAVASGGASRRELSEVGEQVQALQDKLEMAVLEGQHLQANVAAAQRDRTTALANLEVAVNDKTRLQAEMKKLKVDLAGSQKNGTTQQQLEAANATLAGVRRALAEPGSEHQDGLPSEVAKVVLSLRQVTTEMGATQDRLARLEESLAETVTEKEKLSGKQGADKRKVQRKVQDRLKQYEYAARSNKFRFKGSGQKIPCCPVCGGLDASQIEGAEAGHRQNCWFGDMVSELSNDIK